jgi:hypothetical protein
MGVTLPSGGIVASNPVTKVTAEEYLAWIAPPSL